MAKPEPKKSITVPLIAVPVQDDGVHLALKAKINGRVAWLVVDTGASRTVLDKGRASRFFRTRSIGKHDALSTGLGTRNMPSYVAELADFRIGGLRLRGYRAVLLDLKHINRSLKAAGMREIDGVLGGDILLRHRARIDYGRRVLAVQH